MEMTQFRSLKNNPTFVAALIGGILGIGLMTRHTLVGGGGTSYPLALAFVGSLLAGFLAQRNGGKSRSAGITAAILAVLPMSLSVSTPIGYFLETYGIPGIGKATATVVLFIAFLILVSVMTGSLGGGLGGWISNKCTGQSTT